MFVHNQDRVVGKYVAEQESVNGVSFFEDFQMY
jgi:hypothetical protein